LDATLILDSRRAGSWLEGEEGNARRTEVQYHGTEGMRNIMLMSNEYCLLLRLLSVIPPHMCNARNRIVTATTLLFGSRLASAKNTAKPESPTET
jgi:hypothetical protein